MLIRYLSLGIFMASVFFLPLTIFAASDSGPEETDFMYDPADEMISAELIGTEHGYDADVLSIDGTLWFSWLAFTPGEGDRLWIGSQKDGQWQKKVCAIPEPGDYASPKLTMDLTGRLWLSYEHAKDKQWDIYIRPLDTGLFAIEKPIAITSSPAPDIHHDTVAALPDAIWFVWQGGDGGQFDIWACRFDGKKPGTPVRVSNSPRGDWHPSIAAYSPQDYCVAWDTHDGESYNVQIRTMRDGNWGEVYDVTSSPAFEGRAQIAARLDGKAWILWEEGSRNWGAPYFSRIDNSVKPVQQEMNEMCGPMHTYRILRLAELNLQKDRPEMTMVPVPMPNAERALAREHDVDNVTLMGAFYERGRLSVDTKGRLWLSYRHYYNPWLGIGYRSHVENGWGVYARCLNENGWAELQRFNIGQSDGLQRLEIVKHDDGIAAVWTEGRTDRRIADDTRPRDIAFAVANTSDQVSANVSAKKNIQLGKSLSQPDAPGGPLRTKFAGNDYQLYFGDLHRHTDFSLCRVPTDGTLDDAYRYAIDIAELDFMGITDHARDIAQGDHLSQLWWRCRKEVDRHMLEPHFVPFYSYERSHDNTADHNVISLRDDMLRPHTYPVPEFWKELDEDTITIPHQPIRRDTWNYQDDIRRPLLEIFQGCRARSLEDDAHTALGKGYLLGFIASSDHLSTSASYACVWSESPSRESIFKSMKQRRTYGATAKIQLKVVAGEHWMGERFQASAMPPLHIEAKGTEHIRRVKIMLDGKHYKTYQPNRVEYQVDEELELKGNHYIYVYLQQSDGNEAWSSPIWVDIKE